MVHGSGFRVQGPGSREVGHFLPGAPDQLPSDALETRTLLVAFALQGHHPPVRSTHTHTNTQTYTQTQTDTDTHTYTKILNPKSSTLNPQH